MMLKNAEKIGGVLGLVLGLLIAMTIDSNLQEWENEEIPS